MSRVGNRKLEIPTGVTVTVEGNIVSVKGPKGELSTEINENITVNINENEITLTRKNDNFKNFHGTANANIRNMIVGVTEGFKKELEINGVGYRAALQGKDLNLTLGYSHPVVYTPAEGITIEVPAPNKIIVSGANKEMVGEAAAKIREYRLPEPYKGKGIKYSDEVIRRKVGKTGKK